MFIPRAFTLYLSSLITGNAFSLDNKTDFFCTSFRTLFKSIQWPIHTILSQTAFPPHHCYPCPHAPPKSTPTMRNDVCALSLAFYWTLCLPCHVRVTSMKWLLIVFQYTDWVDVKLEPAGNHEALKGQVTGIMGLALKVFVFMFVCLFLVKLCSLRFPELSQMLTFFLTTLPGCNFFGYVMEVMTANNWLHVLSETRLY